ncbi:hypothetical protein RBU60_10955 [Mesonia sp. MT50]|uniref:Uncharacterized protein n=1 Tax=Mesonia profundi TaxID=3070998 RepID=A0ABU1A309_9FLAO|nr:hypothetical protein [Mesonia profundi]MDQ7918097.1 hypothetical protein [Mesonia profundi]
MMKCHTENEVSFLFYAAAMDLHSHSCLAKSKYSYGNCVQLTRPEQAGKIERKVNEFEYHM